MPNTQKHRGKHSKDDALFDKKWIERLHQAADDLGYLLGRGYAPKASLKLVGDRFRFHERQRHALQRVTCSQKEILIRQEKKLSNAALVGKKVAIDGYNLLITLECALSGALLFHCRDSFYRDIASLHSTYKSVEETLPALNLIGKGLEELQIEEAIWYFDAPVSNSGRLKSKIQELAKEQDWNWKIHLANNPDRELVENFEIIISSDGWVIDNAKNCFNFIAFVLEKGWLNNPDIKDFYQT